MKELASSENLKEGSQQVSESIVKRRAEGQAGAARGEVRSSRGGFCISSH